jgi:hypothetical protein
VSRNHRLLILGILILAALAPIASLGDLRARVAALLVLWGAAHAFYLGYEMAKAITALTLSKNYIQDQALRWGFLTVPEQSHREKKREETSG